MAAATEPRSSRFIALLAAAALLLVARGLLPSPAAAAIVPNPDPSLISVWEPCEPDTGVTEIIDFQSLGAHDVQVRCALGEPGTGVSALVGAGFTVAGAEPWGLSFICRIDDLPTPAEQACNHTPGDSEYWSYWHGRPGAQWVYSGVGAANYFPKIGSVEGWGFSRVAEPGVPFIRIPPQDGAGVDLRLPETYASSAIQLRLAQEWLARRLEALTPVGGGGSVNDTEETVSYAVALARSGYDLTGSRFQGARDFLSKAATAGGYTGFGSNPPHPRPERLGTYAIALGALKGGEPRLANDTNMRQWLVEDIEPGTGKILDAAHVFGGEVRAVEDGPDGGVVLEALARTGSLPSRATALIEMIERTQKADGSFVGTPEADAPVMRGLAAAEDAGAGGLGETIANFTAWVLDLQEGDGAIRSATPPEADSTITSTAAGALLLGLGGEEDPAAEAAKWVSPYQITAELAGGGPDSSTGGPASPDVGGFVKSLDAMSEAINYGAAPYTGIEEDTPWAAEALAAAPWLNPVPASVLPPLALSVSASRATVSGVVETGTSAQSTSVQYGTSTAYGSTTLGPILVAEFGQSPVEVQLTGLQPATTYHYRLVATATEGGAPAYSSDETLTTDAVVEVPKDEPKFPSSPGPGPTPQPAPSLASPASIRALAAVQTVGSRRVARLATLSCPTGASCPLTLPKRVRVKIAGERYWIPVLGPSALAGGETAELRVRLPKRALVALSGESAIVTVRVGVVAAGGTQTRTVKVKVRG